MGGDIWPYIFEKTNTLINISYFCVSVIYSSLIESFIFLFIMCFTVQIYSKDAGPYENKKRSRFMVMYRSAHFKNSFCRRLRAVLIAMAVMIVVGGSADENRGCSC